MTAQKFRSVALLCVSIFFCAVLALPTAARADKRVALVIGNSAYGPAAQLGNPRNDATDMAELLKSLGFDVILRVDADRQRFVQALAEFTRAVAGADIGLFFYAGHGMQMNGGNYLVPVDAKLEDEVSVRFEFIPLEEVQRALERSAGVKILVLDACRNNPFMTQLAQSLHATNRDMAVTRGLAPPEKVRGTVVAYATQANDVAADGDGRNSPFTGALLTSLREPGLEIGAMFRKVAARVYETTRGKQVPELSISLLSDVYLNRNETDAQIWARIRAANDPAALRDFLARFPDSFYAADARLRLDVLERADRDRDGAERQRAERAERERAERERADRERLDRERTERERLERERLEWEKAARERIEREVAAERERLEKERVERERAERERVEREKQPTQQAALTPDKPAVEPRPPDRPAAPDEGQLVVAIKTELGRLGCYAAPIDSNWQSPALYKAIADFALRTHLAKVPDSPAQQFLDDLKAREGRICGPECGPREVLDRNGVCVPRNEPKVEPRLPQRPSRPAASPPRQPRQPEAPPRRTGRAGCFSFNGRQFCE